MDTLKNIFTQTERAKAKALAPNDTQAYIEALEKIAEEAYNLWIQMGQPMEKMCASDLYDALAVVDFLHDED